MCSMHPAALYHAVGHGGRWCWGKQVQPCSLRCRCASSNKILYLWSGSLLYCASIYKIKTHRHMCVSSTHPRTHRSASSSRNGTGSAFWPSAADSPCIWKMYLMGRSKKENGSVRLQWFLKNMLLNDLIPSWDTAHELMTSAFPFSSLMSNGFSDRPVNFSHCFC